MLFAVTTIRFKTDSRVFSNADTNTIMLLGDLEKELIGNGCDFSQFERCLEMSIGNSTILQSQKDEYTRMSFIHKIS